MTIADSNSLDLLGKYVSYEVLHDGQDLPESLFGVVEEISFSFHEKASIRFSSSHEFYFLTDIQNIKVLGEVHLHA